MSYIAANNSWLQTCRIRSILYLDGWARLCGLAKRFIQARKLGSHTQRRLKLGVNCVWRIFFFNFGLGLVMFLGVPRLLVRIRNLLMVSHALDGLFLSLGGSFYIVTSQYQVWAEDLYCQLNMVWKPIRGTCLSTIEHAEESRSIIDVKLCYHFVYLLSSTNIMKMCSKVHEIWNFISRRYLRRVLTNLWRILNLFNLGSTQIRRMKTKISPLLSSFFRFLHC